jgi:hypothetical protein
VTVLQAGLLLLLSAATAPTADDLAFFEREVRPVLVQRCYRCHSRGADKVKGGLLLDSRAGIERGGASGARVVAPGDPERSALVRAVRYTDADLEMPPDEKLAPAEIAALEAWVRRGAPDPREDGPARPAAPARTLWSLQPLRATTASTTPAAIDGFITAKLEALRLAATPRADRRTLVRRATFDLTGLPPTPAELRMFLADRAPGAFARLVDRLLASPRYGERWGRHWLDLVRYAESAGCSSDFPVPQAARYRDWVIAAFDRDEPYDRFLQAQLAGDLLSARDDDERQRQIVATGYLALARRFGIKQEESWHLTIEDTIENLGRTMLGLGLGCARCHDHKFDPVSQEDYYALYGVFASTRYPFTGSERTKFQKDFVPLAPMTEVERVWRPFETALAKYDIEIDRMDDIVSAAGAGPEVKPMADRLARLQRERAHFVFGNRPSIPLAYAVAEGKPTDARVHVKGDPKKLGREVPRRFLTALGGELLPPEAARGSGRLELARWITGAGAPLVARVMVNRVWQHHFGRGLVATPSDLLRPWPRRDPQRLRRARTAADAPGAPRPPRLGVHRVGLVGQGDAPGDDADRRLPARERRPRGERGRRPGQRVAVALGPAASRGRGDPRRHARGQRRAGARPRRAARVPARAEVELLAGAAVQHVLRRRRRPPPRRLPADAAAAPAAVHGAVPGRGPEPRHARAPRGHDAAAGAVHDERRVRAPTRRRARSARAA